MGYPVSLAGEESAGGGEEVGVELALGGRGGEVGGVGVDLGVWVGT